jgi:hypothetical protein
LSVSANAAVSIQGSFSDLKNSSGGNVSNGTPFALVGFTGTSFGGGLTINSSITESGANSIFAIGQVLSLNGSLAGGTIFAMGATGGSVAEVVLSGLDNSGNVASGNTYVIYWFQGGSINGANTSLTIGSQAGGFTSSTGTSALGLDPMVIPPNGQDVVQGFATISGGGNVANNLPISVNLIPEPSAALLGALGALGLLRRRRI